MKWLTILAAVVAVLAFAVGLLALAGARLPKEHVASRRVVIHRAPPQVYAVIRDFARAPEWRKDVKRVELLGESGGHLRFKEEGTNGAIPFEVVEDVPAVRLVTRIMDEGLPFGGSWTYELTPVGGGTQVQITERGEVRPVLFRALSKYVFTHHRTIEQYLRALGEHFGEAVTFQ